MIRKEPWHSGADFGWMTRHSNDAILLLRPHGSGGRIRMVVTRIMDVAEHTWWVNRDVVGRWLTRAQAARAVYRE